MYKVICASKVDLAQGGLVCITFTVRCTMRPVSPLALGLPVGRLPTFSQCDAGVYYEILKWWPHDD